MTESSRKSFGTEQVLQSYSLAIRRLRAGGYQTIVVVTDHGFFYWQPDTDEVQLKPEGEILWSSRRAVVGRNLSHPTALLAKVTNSDLDCCIPRGVNSFKAYGGRGYYHGGATLQEIVVPVIVVKSPKKAQKVGVVLKPIAEITSLSQRIVVASTVTQQDLFGKVNENIVSRHAKVKIVQPETGIVIFRAKSDVVIEPGGAEQLIELERVQGVTARRGDELQLRVIDADNEELLDQGKVTLRMDLDEWF